MGLIVVLGMIFGAVSVFDFLWPAALLTHAVLQAASTRLSDAHAQSFGQGDGLPALRARRTTDLLGNVEVSFKVLQIADPHYTGLATSPCMGPPHNPCSEANTTDFIHRLLDHVKPDFVVFTGDQVDNTRFDHTADEVKHAIRIYASPVIQRAIPWAMVFGNHDEGASMNRSDMMSFIASLPFSYSESGPSTVPGVGNFELPVLGPLNQPDFRMYFLDTGVDGAIAPAQINFLRQAALGHRVPAALFFHIPIPEYDLGPGDKLEYGHRGESVCNGPQSGLLDTLVEMGDVKATFVGHDHLNDYCIPRRGVQLCYGSGVGYGQAYGSPSWPRSARVIEWRRNSTKEVMTTWKQDDYDFSKNEHTLFEHYVGH